MSQQIVLTGITTTGTPHLGNFAGAIGPAIKMSQAYDNCYFFLADYHALIKCQEPERIIQSRQEIAATWLALGLNTDKAVFYRQSDIPEITQLTWLLTCVTAKGLMNRAHAYKSAVDANVSNNEDPDKAITMGLFSYPVLMAADILMFKANQVPVGRDQIQHVEMARDIAQRFNHIYGEHFILPEAKIEESVALLPGTDGRKMSKSYNNTIPLFLPEKQLRKAIMRIVTDSSEPGEPKDPNNSTLYELYKAFATEEECMTIRQAYANGIAWGEMKQVLFEKINSILVEPREKYNELMVNPQHVDKILLEGAEKARVQSVPFIAQLKKAVGL